ncbi:MAG: hypothetical protein Q4A32_09405, partial [Lachnospiraceae bacterium]|nr:hypothetical protein [Lachnospiraceae bacterium]
REFGRTSAVGRYSGNKFILLRQIESGKECRALRARIKEIGKSIRKVEGVPLTLYLSVSYTLFSECLELDEQTRMCEMRLDADQDSLVMEGGGKGHMAEVFRLFDDLPVPYGVYHVVRADEKVDAFIVYGNRAFGRMGPLSIDSIVGRRVREVVPFTEENWFEDIEKAAFDGETREGFLCNPDGEKLYRYVANQIICPGYCSVTFIRQ